MKLPSWPATPTSQPAASHCYVNTAKLLTIACVLWLAHFLHSAQFGLYEDDWNRVPRIIGVGWRDLWKMIGPIIFTVSGQGRPLHTSFILFFSFLGFRFGGFQGIYIVAFLLLLASALLFQSFLIKVFRDVRFAFLGTLAFSVFPADTTQPFITHALGLQTAIVLLLLAFNLYLSGWKKISYVVLALILFNYETPFLVFAAAPLLIQRSKYELRKHGAIMFGILAAVAILRTLSADARVSHLSKTDLFLGSLNIVTGPLTCLAMYAYRPFTALLHLRGTDAIAAIVCAFVLTLVLASAYGDRHPSSVPAAMPKEAQEPASSDSRRQLMIGFLLLLLAYPLTLTTTGIAVAGRGTRSHTSAILGASILCAWACSLVLAWASRKNRKQAGIIGVACFYSLLIGFGLTVQHDYVLSWQEQRGFWTDLVALCPSLNDGDAIFVEPSGLRDTRQLLFLRKQLTGTPDTRQIKSLDEVYRVLPIILSFPSDWQHPPRVLRLPLQWKDELFAGGNKLNQLTIEEGFAFEEGDMLPLPASQVIFLDTKDGRLTRRTSLFDPKSGQALLLKPENSVQKDYKEQPVYPYVIYPEGHAKVPYLVR